MSTAPLEIKYPVHCAPSPIKNKFILLHDYEFILEETQKTFTISRGFDWDGATIPRFFWRVIGSPFDPDFMRASLEHDFLCKNEFKYIPYDMAARKFRSTLRKDGVDEWRAYIMYQGVLHFGPKWEK